MVDGIPSYPVLGDARGPGPFPFDPRALTDPHADLPRMYPRWVHEQALYDRGWVKSPALFPEDRDDWCRAHESRRAGTLTNWRAYTLTPVYGHTQRQIVRRRPK